MTPQGTLTRLCRSLERRPRENQGRRAGGARAPVSHLVWTAEDVTGLGYMPLLAHGPTELKFETPPFPVLCTDTVRHVGDAIALHRRRTT